MFLNIRKMTVSGRQWVLTGQFMMSLIIGGGLALWITSTLGDKIRGLLYTDIPASKYTAMIDMEHNAIRGQVYEAYFYSANKVEGKFEDLLKGIAQSNSDAQSYFDKLEKAFASEEMKAKEAAAKTAFEEFAKQAAEIVRLLGGKKEEEAKAKVAEFDQSFKKVFEILAANAAKVQTLTGASESKAEQLQAQTKIYNIVVTVSSLLISLLLSIYLIRSLNSDLSNLVSGIKGQSEKMNVVANQFASDSSGLASTTTQQTSALQETAATLDEISAMVKRTEENSKNLQESSEESQKAAEQGKRSIGEMTESIASIQTSFEQIINQVNSSNSQFTELVDVIKNIGAKTKVINDIVFQTKLLSFNASVEAARAGEHGKGFAVVAQEIGNLAQMSGNAAHDISEMLNSSVTRVVSIVSENKTRIETLMDDGKDKVMAGTRVSKETEGRLHEILEHSTQVNQMISEINASIFEQSRGVREIVNAVSLMNSSTTEISRASESGAAGSKELLAQTQSLNQYILRLESMLKKDSNSSRTDTYDSSPNYNGSKNTLKLEPKKKVVKKPKEEAKVAKVLAMPIKNFSAPAIKAKEASSVAATGTELSIPSSNDPRFEEI